MEIALNNNLARLSPDNEKVAKGLIPLWRVAVDQVKGNKKVVPLEEVSPGQIAKRPFCY